MGIRGMGWKCGGRESAWESGESEWNAKNGNQGGNLSITVEMTKQ